MIAIACGLIAIVIYPSFNTAKAIRPAGVSAVLVSMASPRGQGAAWIESVGDGFIYANPHMPVEVSFYSSMETAARGVPPLPEGDPEIGHYHVRYILVGRLAQSEIECNDNARIRSIHYDELTTDEKRMADESVGRTAADAGGSGRPASERALTLSYRLLEPEKFTPEYYPPGSEVRQATVRAGIICKFTADAFWQESGSDGTARLALPSVHATVRIPGEDFQRAPRYDGLHLQSTFVVEAKAWQHYEAVKQTLDPVWINDAHHYQRPTSNDSISRIDGQWVLFLDTGRQGVENVLIFTSGLAMALATTALWDSLKGARSRGLSGKRAAREGEGRRNV